MAYTLLQYKTAVQAHGFDGQDTTYLVESINAARRDVANAHRWRALESVDTATYTLVVGQPTLTVAKELDGVRIVSGTDGWDLEPMPFEELRTRYNDDQTRGQPQFWAQQGTTLHVYPAPDSAYKIAADVVSPIVALAVDADVETLPDICISPVVYGAAALLAGRHRDYQAADYYENKYQARLLTAMRRDNSSARQGSDQIRRNRDRWDEFNAR